MVEGVAGDGLVEFGRRWVLNWRLVVLRTRIRCDAAGRRFRGLLRDAAAAPMDKLVNCLRRWRRMCMLISMQIDYKKARVLCTDTELSLLNDSKPLNVAKFTPAELKRKVTQARKFSDKWREQAIKQGNSTDGSAAKSEAKHEFFKEALARFDSRLAKVSAPAAVVKKVAVKKVAKKAVAKVAVKAVVKKAVAKKAVAKKAVAKKAGVAKSSKARSAMSLANQAKKKAIGTDLRMSKSGINSRIKGHVSASGRRNQAARSSRKRS